MASPRAFVSSPAHPTVGMEVGSWRCLSKLGTGSFGIVHVWVNKGSGEEIALKRCRFGPEVLVSDKHREQWRQEVDIMQRLQHPNVVRCRPPPKELAGRANGKGDDEEEEEEGGGRRLPLLCMEFCSGGDLRNQLNKARNCVGLEQAQVLGCASDLASALGFLHNRRIIHRDLKPENVVLGDSEDPERRFVYKLIDLGYAKELGQSSMALSFVGTLQYIAPELFLSQEYTKSVDYWSLGFLCFEIATGQRPFLPNFSPGQWMEHVREKSSRVICIHQSTQQERDDSSSSGAPVVVSRETLLPENHLTKSLATDFESWLRPLLEWDPRRRGRRGLDGEVCLFNDLGAILAKRRVAVVCADRVEHKLDYVVASPNATGKDLAEWVERDCGVPSSDQLMLTETSQAVGPCDPVDASKVFVFHFPCNAPVSDRVKLVSLRLPASVQPLLQDPRREVAYPRRKQVVSHTYYFVRQEQQCCRDMRDALKVLVSFVLGRVRAVGSACRDASIAAERALAKFAFFQESLNHDLEKYRQQLRRRDHITSNQMHDSWVASERELASRANDLAGRVTAAKEAVAAAMAATPAAKAALQEEFEEDGDPLGEHLEKSVRLVEGLKSIPVEGRRERESLLEVAQLVVKVLKRRDRFLHDHLRRRMLVLDCHRAGLEAARAAAQVSLEAEALSAAVSKGQRRRQSDLWKLLAAAVQQTSTTPSPKKRLPQGSQSPAGGTDRLLEENKDLRGRIQDVMKTTEDAIRLNS